MGSKKLTDQNHLVTKKLGFQKIGVRNNVKQIWGSKKFVFKKSSGSKNFGLKTKLGVQKNLGAN